MEFNEIEMNTVRLSGTCEDGRLQFPCRIEVDGEE
jgi:hypothetical protein